MAFFEQQMNPDITFGAKGGPAWSTSKAFTAGGQSYVNRNWSQPLHRYDVQYCIKKESDFNDVINMFYVVSGAYDGFRFKDWRDYRHNDSGGTGVLTFVTGTTWQLFKTYTKGARTFSRKITKPVANTVIVTRNRSGVLSTAVVTLDNTTGSLLMTGHVGGDTYTWTGEFDVPVRFVSDEFMAIISNQSGSEFLMDSGPIMLEEIRL